MCTEIETKFAVESLEPVHEALEQVGAVRLRTVLQTDRFFDTLDHGLRGDDCGLRIRTTSLLDGGAEPGDTRPQVTYKGPRSAQGTAKSRLEVQTHADDADALARILLACGMHPTLTIQKRRTTYRLADCLIELDELPVIGPHVEVEGPDHDAVITVSRKLGLNSPSAPNGVAADGPTTRSYIELITAACREAGVSCKEITFESCGRCRQPEG